MTLFGVAAKAASSSTAMPRMEGDGETLQDPATLLMALTLTSPGVGCEAPTQHGRTILSYDAICPPLFEVSIL